MPTLELYMYNTASFADRVFSLAPMGQLSTRFLQLNVSPTRVATQVFCFKGSIFNLHNLQMQMRQGWTTLYIKLNELDTVTHHVKHTGVNNAITYTLLRRRLTCSLWTNALPIQKGHAH
jgi:hypothetical protein